MKRTATAALAVLSLVLLVSGKRRAVTTPSPPELILDPERSFVVVDTPLIEGFTFKRVMNAITAGTNVSGEELFRQWWSTQAEPQCHELLNGYARRCPTTEGRLAVEPYRPEDFRPIGVINRFDQAGDTQCGQYRIIFASRDVMDKEAFHLIFEGELPNPRPDLGLAACRPVAQFWADLTGIESGVERRERLERFFFEGLEGFEPVVHPDHYHQHQAGIRTLQLTMPEMFPHFFQFRVVRENGTLLVRPDVLEDQPAASLFDATLDDERGRRFREVFLANVETLAIRDANLYFMRIPPEFLLPDPRPEPQSPAFALGAQFVESSRTPEGRAYEQQIADALRRIGSTLTPAQVVTRAETLSCTGCHFTGTSVGEGVEFPSAMDGAQHVSEDAINGGTPQKYAISPAMRDVFVPHRVKILRDFLLYGKAPVHSN